MYITKVKLVALNRVDASRTNSFRILELPGDVIVFDKGGGQPFQQPIVERPIFSSFEIPNIKKTKNEIWFF